jgi:hypothetical protein
MKYGFVFVCQEGILEVQSAILAASLIKNVIGDYVISVGIPNFGKVSKSIIELFEILKINVFYFKNNFNPFYAEGNKILASNIELDVDKKIFLDSDVVCVKNIDLNIFNNLDFYCTAADPYIALSEIEWKSVYDLFKLEIPKFQDLNKLHTQAVFVLFRNNKDFSKQWLDNAMFLNKSIHEGKLYLHRRRQIDQVSLGVTLLLSSLKNCKIDFPMSWDGRKSWWLEPRCVCHLWEKSKFIGERSICEIVSMPDMVFGYKNKKPFCVSVPYFLTLQNGANFCEVHQGRPLFHPKYWIDHYPFVKDVICNIINEFPCIRNSKYWDFYQSRYLLNSDKVWFGANRNIGNYIPKNKELKFL